MQTLLPLLLTGVAVAGPSALRRSRRERVLHPSLDVVKIGHVAPASPEMLPEGDYDGMMFANGMMMNGSSTWVARVCTGGCKSLPFDSKVIWGHAKNDVSKAQWSWTGGAEVPVNHSSKGACTGPEDPRLDAVEGKLFFLANVNVERPESHCSVVRRQVFVPMDSHTGAKQCIVEVDEQGLDECADQKNWVPLVPKGSRNPFFVYSLVPFQVMSFDRQSCKAGMVKPGGIRRADFQDVRSSTRYVHGLDVEEGAIYWSVGHTPPLEYKWVFTAVLAKRAGQKFDFELLGTSCSFSIPGLLTEDQLFAYPSSILDFNADADIADVTFHIDDSLNKVATLKGVKEWLREAHQLWKSGGSFKCKHQVVRHLSSSNVSNQSAADPPTTSTNTTATTTTTTRTTTTTAAVTTTTTATTTMSTTTSPEPAAVITATGFATLKVENATAFCADNATSAGMQKALAETAGVEEEAVTVECSAVDAPARRLQSGGETVRFDYTITIPVDTAEQQSGAVLRLQQAASALRDVDPAVFSAAVKAAILTVDPGASYTVEVQEIGTPEIVVTSAGGVTINPTTSTATTTDTDDDDLMPTRKKGYDSAAVSPHGVSAMASILTAALLLGGV